MLTPNYFISSDVLEAIPSVKRRGGSSQRRGVHRTRTYEQTQLHNLLRDQVSFILIIQECRIRGILLIKLNNYKL